MILLRNLLEWLTLWFGGWYGWIFLVKRGFNSIKTYRLTAGYFLFLSGVVWLCYRVLLYNYFSFIIHSFLPISILSIFFIAVGIIYFFAQKIFDKQMLSEYYDKRLFVAMMDYRFLLVKSCDILFQQLAFISLFMILQKASLGFWQTIFTAGLFFGAIHLPLMIIRHHSLVKYFVIASFFAGGVFAFFLLSRPYGFIYSYIIHWSFYLCMGLTVNIAKNKKKRRSAVNMVFNALVYLSNEKL